MDETTATARDAASALLATLDADPTAAIDPGVVRAVAAALLATPAPEQAFGVEFMAEDWHHWVDAKVAPMPSKAAAEALVRGDSAHCRVVTRLEYTAQDWTPTGYAPKSPANPLNGTPLQ